jgi:diguanylate cyclase (GGDEF)-like protein
VTIGRLGGDEFLALMPASDDEAALAAARGVIASIEHVGASVTRFPLSASVGIATGTRTETLEQLLRRADQAMYRAKSAGSGQIELSAAEPEVAATRGERNDSRTSEHQPEPELRVTRT